MTMYNTQKFAYTVWEIAMVEDASHTPDHLTDHLLTKGTG